MNSSSKISTLKDDIDLGDLFNAIWQGKILIIFISILTILIAVLYLQNATAKYSVRMVYKTVQPSNAPNFGSLSGLASLANLELPGSDSSSDVEVFKYLITSVEVGDIILSNPLLVRELFSNEFDVINNTYKMPEMNRLAKMKKKIKLFITGRETEPYIPPNAVRVARILKKSFLQKVDKKTGFITFSAETNNPQLTVKLIDYAVNTTDELLKNRYIESLTSSLSFYQKKLSQAKSREHREALAKLIVMEQKRLMLVSTGNDYVIEPITKPEISLYPTSPNVSAVLIIGFSLGMFLGVSFVLFRKLRET